VSRRPRTFSFINSHGPASAAQLVKLNASGALELVEAGAAIPITKSEACAAIGRIVRAAGNSDDGEAA
jgi:hypothetical protein